MNEKQDQFSEFEQVIQEKAVEFFNTITQHPYFLQLHLDLQTDFLSDMHEAFEKSLRIDLEPMCDNFNQIFDDWEKQDWMSQVLRDTTARIKTRKNLKVMKKGEI